MSPLQKAQAGQLEILQKQIVACTRCSRLVRHCRKTAREKRRMYRDWDYWGKPVPGFGDPEAELLILGLAPAAHGANRTGRMFTGDRSGEFLYRALHQAGFASQPTSLRRDDGLELRGCYITAALRCAPPENKPLPAELGKCQQFLEKEFELLGQVRAVLALGRIAFDTYLRLVYAGRAGPQPGAPSATLLEPASTRALSVAPLKQFAAGARNAPLPKRSTFRFAHGGSYELPGGLPHLFASYHPSQQNTQTGRLTPEMLRRVFLDVRKFLGRGTPSAAPPF